MSGDIAKMQVKVLTSQQPTVITELINEHIADDWTLSGDLIVTPMGSSFNYFQYTQMMIKWP